MKILFIVHSLVLGGATKQLALTANSLVKQGHDVSIYTYSFNSLCEYPLSEKVQYITETCKYNSKLKEYLLTPFRVRKIIKKITPHIVIGWRTNAGYMTALATLGTSFKSIFCERSDPYMEDNMFLHVAKWICNLNDGGIFQTDGARQYYKCLARKSVVIPNPYSYDGENVPFISIADRPKEIALVGRLFIKQKRQDVAIKAFAEFSLRHSDYKLKIYGDGVDRLQLQNLVRSLGIADKVDFLGAVDGVIRKISCSRLMLLSSDYEGIPNVILEAFTAKTPVVTTDCSPGGAHTLIKDGYNGFIVPREDSHALCLRMETLITNEELAAKFIHRSLEKIKLFENSRIFGLWNEYLNKITCK